MSQEQVSRLRALLERVQHNAAQPRVRAAAVAPPLVAVAEPIVVSPPVAAPEPVAVVEPEPPVQPVAVPVPEELHEQITGVRVIDEVGAAPELEAVSVEVEELDLDAEEIVDITDVPAEEIGAEEIGAEEVALTEAEEAPASSRRAIAGTVGEALAGAAETVELDEGREIPLKTPPPESGPQIAPPPIPAAPVPDIETAHEVELVSGPQPTAAQLGATVELEEGEETAFEMGEPIAEAPPVHLVREERIPTPPPPAPPPPAPPAAVLQPERVQRPAVVAASPAHAVVHAPPQFHPKSFLELLDASLSLGQD